MTKIDRYVYSLCGFSPAMDRALRHLFNERDGRALRQVILDSLAARMTSPVDWAGLTDLGATLLAFLRESDQRPRSLPPRTAGVVRTALKRVELWPDAPNPLAKLAMKEERIEEWLAEVEQTGRPTYGYGVPGWYLHDQPAPWDEGAHQAGYAYACGYHD